MVLMIVTPRKSFAKPCFKKKVEKSVQYSGITQYIKNFSMKENFDNLKMTKS